MSEISTKNSKNEDFLAFAIGGFVAIILVSMLLFYQFDFLRFKDEGATARVLAAILTMIGSFIAMVGALIGLLIKKSLDDKNHLLQKEALLQKEQSENENRRLQEESEKRLRLDTAIRAVELFKSATETAKAEEAAGALFALVQLNQNGFALTLLDQLWSKNKIETPTAIFVISHLLKDEKFSSQVALLMEDRASKLNTEQGRFWPAEYSFTLHGLPYLVRERLLMARMKSLINVDLAKTHQTSLNTELVFLFNLVRHDPSTDIKQSAAAFLSILIEFYQKENWIILENEELSTNKIRKQLTSFGPDHSGHSQQAEELRSSLEDWFEQG